MQDETLYERLGGRDAIEAVVDEFYERVLADEHLQSFFEDVDMTEQRAHQTRFLVTAAGGPDLYDGESMAEAHDHLDIGHEDFSRIAVHLADALREFDVADGDVAAVVGTVESYREPIVSV